MSWLKRLLARIAPSRPPQPSGPDLLDGLGPGQGGWRTNCCGSWRPDAVVGVRHVPITGLESSFPGTRMNFKYCTDNPDCIAAAERAAQEGAWP